MRSNLPAFPEMAAQLNAILPSRGRNTRESQSRIDGRLSTEAASSPRNTANISSDDSVPPSATDSNQLVVSNAVIGLIAASAQTFNDLDSLNVAYNTKTQFLLQSLSVLKSFKLTIQLIYKFLRRLEMGTLERKDRPSLIGVDVIIVTLSEPALAISELGNLLFDAAKQAAQGSVPIAEILQTHRGVVENKTRRIAAAEVLMTKLLSVLQVESDFEARRHLSQTETGICEILQENVTLADRMRRIADMFGARTLIPNERLEAIAAHGPPAYSVPTSVAEALPKYSAAVGNGIHADGSVTIRPTCWSVFSGTTLGDISILSLLPLPIMSNELRYGTRFYTFEYSRRVNEPLGELAEQNTRSKAEALARILDLRNVGAP